MCLSLFYIDEKVASMVGSLCHTSCLHLYVQFDHHTHKHTFLTMCINPNFGDHKGRKEKKNSLKTVYYA